MRKSMLAGFATLVALQVFADGMGLKAGLWAIGDVKPFTQQKDSP